MENIIRSEITKAESLAKEMAKDEMLIQIIKNASLMCIQALQSNKKILLAGNGGSAADSQHIAGELVSRFNYDRPGLSAIALTTDTSILTAAGNDYGYSKVFSRQIEALGETGDIFIAYSTSGNSENILEALNTTKTKGIKSIGMTGNKDGKMNELCDVVIAVPSNETPKIQEGHLIIGHIICNLIESTIFPR